MVLELLYGIFLSLTIFIFLRDLIRATGTEQKRGIDQIDRVHDDKNTRAQSYKLSCKTITTQPPNAFSVLPLLMPPRPTRPQQSRKQCQ